MYYFYITLFEIELNHGNQMTLEAHSSQETAWKNVLLGLKDAILTFLLFVNFNVIQIFTSERYHKSALCFPWGRDSVTET